MKPACLVVIVSPGTAATGLAQVLEWSQREPWNDDRGD